LFEGIKDVIEVIKWKELYEMMEVVIECYNKLGNEVIVAFFDELKDIGFCYVILFGFSIGIVDMYILFLKGGFIENAWCLVIEVE